MLDIVYLSQSFYIAGLPEPLQDNKTSAITRSDHSNDRGNNIHSLNIDKSHHNESHGRSNDVMVRFNITPEFDQSVTEPSHVTLNDTQTTRTTQPEKYSPKPIYVRGHLVYHPSPWPRKHLSKILKMSHQALRAPDYANDFRDEADGANSRRKRKHSSSRDRIQNYNMIYHKETVCFCESTVLHITAIYSMSLLTSI